MSYRNNKKIVSFLLINLILPGNQLHKPAGVTGLKNHIIVFIAV